MKKVIIPIIAVIIIAAIGNIIPPSQSQDTAKSEEITSAAVAEKENDTEQTEMADVQAVDQQKEIQEPMEVNKEKATPISLDTIPEFSNQPFVKINDGIPFFTETEYTTESYEHYSELDRLGRCGVVMACVGQDLMPIEDRGTIGPVKPTGWHTVKYDFVDGKYLYNRCHLIGYQLSGENANEKNLITGTRYLNIEGMLPFENKVSDYVSGTGNHVLFRVTPIYDGDNLLASGVLMEAYSVEDNGQGITFNIYAYNNQPGVIIDYATGDSELDGSQTVLTDSYNAETSSSDVEVAANAENQTTSEVRDYVLNTNTMRFHYPTCNSVTQMKEKNKKEFTGTREELMSQGYGPCGNCNP